MKNLKLIIEKLEDEQNKKLRAQQLSYEEKDAEKQKQIEELENIQNEKLRAQQLSYEEKDAEKKNK